MNHPAKDRDGAAATGDLSAAERIALLALVAMIPLRAVLSETRTFEMPPLFRNLDTPPGAMPATTMGIFAVIAGAALLASCARWWRGGPSYRWTGAELGAAMLALAMAISTYRAGQKHLALTGSLDFLGLLLFFLTLRQLLVRRWHVRLVMVTILATGAMVVAKCAYQKWVEIPATIRYYEEHKEEMTRPIPGETERSAGLVYDYEQRLRSGAVTGFFSHPNVLGSYLILVILTAAAVVQGRMRNRAAWTTVVPGAIGFAAAAMLFYSQSKGAGAACALAILIWLAGGRFAEKIRRHRHATIVVFWTTMALGAASLAAVLQFKPDALGRSMLFRSLYWRGATNLMKHESLWGIGANNFGRYFTRYKPAACPEDVDDPHSWLMKAAAEWGVLGAIGLIAVFLGVSRILAGKGSEIPDSPPRRVESDRSGGSIILWCGGIGAIVFGWWAAVLSGSPKDYTVLILSLPAVSWIVGFIAVSCERREIRFFLDEPAGPMIAALCGGLIGFLVHTGIDLAMFQGGSATTFFAMMAVAIALREPAAERAIDRGAGSARKTVGVILGTAGVGGLAAFFVIVVRPMAVEGAALQEARTNCDAKTWDEYLSSKGYEAYSRAMDAWTLDATAIDELVEELSRRVRSVSDADYARQLVQLMELRDPRNSSIQNHFATLYYQRFRLGGDPGDLQRSILAMAQAVSLYPSSPTRRISLANLYEQMAQATNSPQMLQLAAKEMRKALELDEQRIYVSTPNRLSAAKRSAIEKRVLQLERVNSNPLGGH